MAPISVSGCFLLWLWWGSHVYIQALGFPTLSSHEWHANFSLVSALLPPVLLLSPESTKKATWPVFHCKHQEPPIYRRPRWPRALKHSRLGLCLSQLSQLRRWEHSSSLNICVTAALVPPVTTHTDLCLAKHCLSFGCLVCHLSEVL